MNPSLRQIVLASTFIAFSGLGAFAAPSDAPAVTSSGMPDHKPTPAATASPEARTMMQRVEKRITELHTALRITAAQQPQWDGFIKVMRENATQMDAAVITDVNTMAKLTAVEQMKTYAKIAEQHAKDVRNLVPAFDSLYGTMSPEQKLNADNYFRADAQRAHHGRKA